VVVFPVTICRIKKSLMYVEANGYKHPVVVTNNHFTLPVEFKKIFRNPLERVTLLPISSEDSFYYFIGSFIKGSKNEKESYGLTINKKIRDVLGLKERDVIEVRLENNTFYTRVWWRTGKNSMVCFFPSKIFKMLNLKPNTPYQIKIKKSEKTFVSNEHFYSANKVNLEFEKFVENKKFNLYEFLKNSYARTEGGKLRKFKIREVDNDNMLVNYFSGGPASKEIKIKSTFTLDPNFFRVMGLLQAECSKSLKKAFCFTNETPENIKYVIEWFEKYLNFSRESWLYELIVDSRVKSSEDIKSKWANFLKINPDLIKVYSKKFGTKKLNTTGIMNLKSPGRTLKEIIMRLLECTKTYVSKDGKSAGYFLSGVLAGDGYVVPTRKGSLNYVGISFNPNKIREGENELQLYISCLKAIGIPTNDIKIYINEHEKAKDFIKVASKYGVEIKACHRKRNGFGGEINIFKFRSFQKLAQFNPFFPNKLNVERFNSLFNRIDRSRIRFL
jgi:hypothetical protein